MPKEKNSCTPASVGVFFCPFFRQTNDELAPAFAIFVFCGMGQVLRSKKQSKNK